MRTAFQRVLTSVFLAVVVVGICRAREDSSDGPSLKRTVSPDGIWLAAERNLPDRGHIWDSSSGSLVLVIWPYEDGKIFDRSFLRWDSDSPSAVVKMAWSPDSQFLLFTTTGLKGDSPWHFPTFVFCASDKSIRSVDAAVGPVQAAEFKFVGSHVVSLKAGDPSFPQVQSIDLAKTALKMITISNLKFENEP